MRTLYYFLIGILLFYIDTAIGLLIPMHIGKFELVFVPHLTFMYILMMVVYRGFGVSLLLSIFLGVMTDVYFGSIYGVYLFGYILFLALMHRFFKIFYKDHSMLFIIILASTLLLEVYVALIYGMLGFIQFDIIHFVVFRLLPTLIMNFVLLIMLYPLIIKFLKNKQWHWHETSSMVRCNSWVVISSYIQPLKYRFKNIFNEESDCQSRRWRKKREEFMFINDSSCDRNNVECKRLTQ